MIEEENRSRQIGNLFAVYPLEIFRTQNREFDERLNACEWARREDSERTRSIREAPTGTTAAVAKLSVLRGRMLLLLLLPAYRGRIGRCHRTQP